ncbi:hypothetical protein D6D01_07271 [Aureobasidium pullulans]|uniref:Uncharacterized protein n=1 Tax=Aureobasidium pullulans TaxID=5580 RepID=A0A4S9KQ68_AURPU|nr:hypothetical protein D6D01_07271 [Aureobasidium pullulans]
MAGPDAKFDCEKGGGEMLEAHNRSAIDTRLHLHEPFHVAKAGAMLQASGALSFLSALCVDAPSRLLIITQLTLITSALLSYLAGAAFVIYAVRSAGVRWRYMFFKAVFWADGCMKVCMYIIGTAADWRLAGAIMMGTVISVLEALYLDKRFRLDVYEE